jgi:predicted Zn-dependent peptidase
MSLHRLANGVTVVCDPVAGFETLALSVVAGRGARFEDAPRSGWSHLLEHMVFKGAGELSARDIVEVIEAAGGHINAATGQERTSFQVRALKGGLPLALAVAGDLILRPTLDAEELAKEIRVVGQEIAEAADTPDDQVFELANAAAFPGQPLGRPILGTTETIAAADSAALGAWRADIYAPDRMVVSAAGAVDEDELLALAEAVFGRDRPPPTPRAAEPATFAGGRGAEKRRLEQAHLVFLLPAPSLTDPDYWALRLFAEMLGGGMSSRLFQEAREKLGLAYAIDAWTDAWADAGVLGVYAGCAARDAARLAALTAREILSLARGPDTAELARAKAQLKSGLYMSRESLAARAEQAAAQVLAFGRPLAAAEMGEAIDQVTAGNIARLAGRLLVPGRSASATLGPTAAMGAGAAFEDGLQG